MTALALRAEPPFMHIVARVATDAGTRLLHLLAHRTPMAGEALQAIVATIECEAGARVVIEIPLHSEAHGPLSPSVRLCRLSIQPLKV